ncbi:hypothetical protein AB0G73_24330 [Streptomyces sp. NPDC020719]|uniref:hypothetical protein n=1 Tax=Streptomyces sp. NPDC020719 TaxID=3154896 RepID=UPI0033E5FBFD
MSATTLADVRAFVAQLPSPQAVAAVQEACAQQLLTLDRAARPVIAPGRHAKITGIRPVFLGGLTGTVQEPNKTATRWQFLLDEDSTRALRRDPRNTKFTVPDNVTRYRIPGKGIPAGCLELLDA